MNRFDYDVAIIGGGSGGYAAAATATGAGLRAVVIEGGREIGGLCILRGCMPTKALLYAADVIHLARSAAKWGIRAPEVGFHFAAVMARKDAMIKGFADYRVKQLTTGKFEFIRATARFKDPHTLALSDGRTLTAKSFVLSTGSVVAEPPLPSLKDAGYLTSDEALSLETPPKSLIVLGGGAVAVEFTQFFTRFDVQVTMIQRSEHVLREFDADAATELENVFRREGVRIFTQTRLIEIEREGALKTVTFEHEGETVRVSAEEILFALGRTPNTANLGLENAGVKTERDGRIVTNAEMQTSAPHIYAAGDCAASHEIVHIAVQQGETAAHNIAHSGNPRRMDHRLLTTVVFTDPQIGCVGLTEREAKMKNIPYVAASYPFNDHGKSLIMGGEDGFVKLLADPKTGEILGGCCVGLMGGELIHEIIAAMAKRMTVHELAAMPHYHPTLAEIWTYPAEELMAQIKER